jgi:hypothetical protein
MTSDWDCLNSSLGPIAMRAAYTNGVKDGQGGVGRPGVSDRKYYA